MTNDTADNYFAVHLMREKWSNQTADIKTAAIAMAQQDVELEIGEIDDTDTKHVAAVCEQAIWLLSGAAAAQQQQHGQIVSETVSGVGSRTYATNGGAAAAIGPRAKRLIDDIRGTRRTVRTMR